MTPCDSLASVAHKMEEILSDAYHLIMGKNEVMVTYLLEMMYKCRVPRHVEAGETLVIMREGKPVAEVKPVGPRPEIERPFGLCAGEFKVPDDFDAPLPEDILKAFEGK